MTTHVRSSLAALLVFSACTGQIADPSGTEGPGGPNGPDGVDPVADAVWVTGARRLSRTEYARTVGDLLGVSVGEALLTRLPEDTDTPFDAEYTEQQASAAYVEAVEAVARDLAARSAGPEADPDVRASLIGCTPTGPGDAECLDSFIRRFGRLALRRPLTGEEIAELMTLGEASVVDDAYQDPSFYHGTELVVLTLLQHPELLYRVERVTEPAGPLGYRLSSYEVASRLSFLLLGTTPDEALLDAAAAGELDSPEGVRAVAEQLLVDPRGRARIQEFHAMWLGYRELPHDEALAAMFRRETEATIAQVLFEEQRPWTDLLRTEGTFVDDALAAHYGLPAPGSDTPVWVDYGASGRRGILSHAAILSNGRKYDDTNVVQRGLFVRERLLCQDIPPPPPNVNTDDAQIRTPESPCKIDQSLARREGVCGNCHDRVDPIGFGLEQYDGAGRFRAHEPDLPECTLDGEGELQGVGTFNGPAGLGELLADSDALDLCLVQTFYRFASGHEATAPEAAGIESLTDRFRDSGRRFDALILDLVGSEAFLHHRTEDEAEE